VYPEAAADLATRLIGRVGQPRPADIDEATADRVRLSDLSSLDDLSAEELVEYEQLRIKVREIDYESNEQRGTLGLESALEPLLRGKRGWLAAVRDAQGNIDGEVESAPPQRGLNVTLSLDIELQSLCERTLQSVFEGQLHGRPQGWPGAIVLLDPQTGQVLALAGAPAPTRREFEGGYAALVASASGPLRERAIAAGSTGNLPPPGSTFKPFAALAALEAGRITAGQHFECDGQLSVGGLTLGCLGRHGAIALEEAIARSCNLYFYHLADATGGETLRALALEVGFGAPTRLLRDNAALEGLGIHLDGGVVEESVPFPAREFRRTESMRIAIGQAPLDDVTPLQVAAAFGALGTGIVRPPTLIASVEGYGPVPPDIGRPLAVSAAHLQAVRAALAAVVDSPGGTANRLRALVGGELAGRVAGKTGTPQVQGLPDHSWFAGYMPREQPRVAFAILLEHTGEHGGDACVPVLAALLESPALRELAGPEVGP
ncbi:MAG TPA: penicillin-binding transpeptidase domain-containing protein, partial [Planctomycetota bacterium]|nr:penicillin-binding transpeptidase domain-containing protein [Planctomycetota bacterium]